MFPILSFAAALALPLVAIAAKAQAAKATFLYCTEGDDDMKIASDFPSDSLRAGQDNGETVAKEYTRQKENGNIFLANRLGEELAKPLLRGDSELMGERVNAKNIGQLYFLYGFAVRTSIAQSVDSPILADTVLRSFHDTVKSTSEPIYEAMNDSVPDTIYRLCQSCDDCIGEGFARLCGEEGQTRFITLGRETYESYQVFAMQKIDKVEFHP